MMCLSAGKSVGEIAWRRCEGIGSRGHVVGWLERRSLDTSASVRGQKEKMGVWAVDVVGWRSSVCGGENWLLIVLVFFCEESGEVIGYYRSGGRWWRGTEERIKCSEEIMCVWSAVNLVMELVILLCEDLTVWTPARTDESKDWYLLRSDESFDLHNFLSAALRLVRCSRRTLDNQELEGAARAGLEERGQMLSRQEVKVEHKVSVAAFTSRDEKWVGEGREEDTTEERWEGKRERRFRLKVSGRAVGGTQVAKCNLNVMKKWSEICSGSTKMLSAVQLRV